MVSWHKSPLLCVQHLPQKWFFSAFSSFTICSELHYRVGVCLTLLTCFMTLLFTFSDCKLAGAVELEHGLLAAWLLWLAELGQSFLAVVPFLKKISCK